MVAVVVYLRLAGTRNVLSDDDRGTEHVAAAPASRFRGGEPWRWLRERALNIYAGLAIAYMLIPIAVIAVFSFNDPTGNFNITWQGSRSTTGAIRSPTGELTDALLTSLELAAISTVVATVIGTMLALALVRHRFRGGAQPAC